MSQEKYALLFLQPGANQDNLTGVLREVGLRALEPQQLAGNTGRVALVIVDRPYPNSLTICNNLRQQNEFRGLPMLALVTNQNAAQLPQYSAIQVDVMPNPVKPLALRNYLIRKLQLAPAGGGDTTAILPETPFRVPPTVPLPATVGFRPGDSSGQSTILELEDKPPSLADEIPDSARLLSTVKRPLTEDFHAVLLCNKCHWRLRPEDAFCAKCREQLALLNKLPEEVVFEPVGSHKVGQLLDLRNVGQNPLHLDFDVAAQGFIGTRFKFHTDGVTLGPGKGGQLLITLDANDLDLSARYQAVLEIGSNEKGYTKRQVQLIVESLPRPRITTADGARGCDYIIGADNVWQIKLHNEGGGTLRLTRLDLAVASLNTTVNLLAGAPENPCAAVKGGATALIDVRLPPLELAVGTYYGKLNCEFAHLPTQTQAVSINALRPARIAVQPNNLDFGIISVNRSGHAELTVTNVGGEELRIDSLDTGNLWLYCQKPALPLRVAPGGTVIFDFVAQGGAEWVERHEGAIILHSNAYGTPKYSVRWRATFVAPRSHEEFIGVDFGTTASCVAVLDKNGVPRTVRLERAGTQTAGDPRIMPSVLYIGDDGKILTGVEALDQRRIQPSNAIDSIKRALGGQARHRLGRKDYQATELTAMIIRELLLRAESGMFRLGVYETPRQAIVTAPVEFTDSQRRALLEACTMAGLDMVTAPDAKYGIVLDEASAAALCYVRTRREVMTEERAETLLVFDFGGGTLDCALIRIEKLPPEYDDEESRLIFETLAIGGDPRLGGEDLDWALVGILSDKVRDAHPNFDVDCLHNIKKFQMANSAQVERAARECRTLFKQQAETAKIQISQQLKAGGKIAPATVTLSKLLRKDATETDPFIADGRGLASFQTTLSLAELELTLKPYLQRAERVVQTLCDRAKVPLDKVDTILHVGRSSLLKLVPDRINKLLPGASDLSEIIEPKLCVAVGAAYWGQLKDLSGMSIEFRGGAAKRTVHDVGYAILGQHEGRTQLLLKTVFPAQTEFPCRQTLRFRPRGDILTLPLMENRGQNPALEDNAEIRRIGQVRIDTCGVQDAFPVEFTLDANRLLAVTANGQTYCPEMTDEE